MKKRDDILELSVICIDEGIEFGKVKELIIDPELGKVVYLIIDDGDWYLGAKILKFQDILGIGKHAVTTQTAGNITEIRGDDEVLELVKKGIKIIDAKMFSEDGEYIGSVEEFYLDIKDGSIIKCLLEGGSREEVLASNIITYGKNVLIVEDDINNKVLKEDGKDIDTFIPDDLDDIETDKGENIFEKRQRKFVLGRRATKVIKDKDGNNIVEKDQIIDEATVERVANAGKLVELTMNIQ